MEIVDDTDLLQQWWQQEVEPFPTIKHQCGNDRVAEEQSDNQEKRAVADAREDGDSGVSQQLAQPWPIEKEARAF